MNSAIFLLSGRERISAVLAALPFYVLAFLSTPRRTIVDGREIVELAVFGHIVPIWFVLVTVAILFLMLWKAVHVLITFLWPEEQPPTTERTHMEIAALPKVPEGLVTPAEYLLAEEPSVLGSIFYDFDWGEEYVKHDREMARWQNEATEEMLESLIEEVRALPRPISEEVGWNLFAAYEARAIPSLENISALAEEIDDEHLRTLVAERRTELKKQESTRFSK